MSISVRFELCHLESGSNCGILCSVRIVSSSVRVASFSIQNVTFCVRVASFNVRVASFSVRFELCQLVSFEFCHFVSGSKFVI